jgi:hypothetical protein
LVHVDTFQITLFNFRCCCCSCCCWVTSTFHINQDCGYLWPTSTFSFFALNISKRDHFFQKLSPPRPIWFHRLHKSQIKLGKSFIWKHEHSRSPGSPRRHEQEKKRDVRQTRRPSSISRVHTRSSWSFGQAARAELSCSNSQCLPR